jgi:hypothetical protein
VSGEQLSGRGNEGSGVDLWSFFSAREVEPARC